MFQQNLGVRDRDIRLGLVGPLAVLALFFLPGGWTIVVGGVALILLVTAALSFCPLYRLLGITTIETREAAVEVLPHRHKR
jgi:hypothetical protein